MRNLCRADLTPAQEAVAISRRKVIYEKMHPETIAAKDGGPGPAKKRRQNGDASPADRFTKDTAAKTGKSERAVQRNATRGKKIGTDNLRKIAGTSLKGGLQRASAASTLNSGSIPNYPYTAAAVRLDQSARWLGFTNAESRGDISGGVYGRSGTDP